MGDGCVGNSETHRRRPRSCQGLVVICHCELVFKLPGIGSIVTLEVLGQGGKKNWTVDASTAEKAVGTASGEARHGRRCLAVSVSLLPR